MRGSTLLRAAPLVLIASVYAGVKYYRYRQRNYTTGEVTIIDAVQFDELEVGMTQMEAESLLGPGLFVVSEGKPLMSWVGSDGSIYTVVYTGHDTPVARTVVFKVVKAPDGESHLAD